MATFTAPDDGGDDDAGLTEEQRAALVRAFSTPALTLSMERMRSQFSSIAEQVNGQFARVVAAELEPVLRVSRIQTSIAESLQPVIAQQLNARRMLEPLFAQIVERQQQWAKALVVPLAANARMQAQLAGLLVTPELTAALERINEVARLRFELPDQDGLDRPLTAQIWSSSWSPLHTTHSTPLRCAATYESACHCTSSPATYTSSTSYPPTTSAKSTVEP